MKIAATVVLAFALVASVARADDRKGILDQPLGESAPLAAKTDALPHITLEARWTQDGVAKSAWIDYQSDGTAIVDGSNFMAADEPGPRVVRGRLTGDEIAALQSALAASKVATTSAKLAPPEAGKASLLDVTLTVGDRTFTGNLASPDFAAIKPVAYAANVIAKSVVLRDPEVAKIEAKKNGMAQVTATPSETRGMGRVLGDATQSSPSGSASEPPTNQRKPR